jgi:NADH-quinone oxidoreductase subunit C
VKVEEQANGSPLGAAEVIRSQIAGALHSFLPDADPQLHGTYIELSVPTAQLEKVALLLRDMLSYRLLSMVTSVDFPDQLEVIYLIFSLEHPHGVFLKTSLPRTELPDCPTLTTVWPGAEFQEREVYDMMGINFVGHPDMTRILTEDDFPGHPLRKDFTIEPDYVLMRHLRFGAEGQLAPGADPGQAPDDGGQR